MRSRHTGKNRPKKQVLLSNQANQEANQAFSTPLPGWPRINRILFIGKDTVSFLYKHRLAIFILFLILASIFMVAAGAIGFLLMRNNNKNNDDNVCDGFDLYSGETEGAKLILLGEYHNRPTTTAHCIERLTKNKSNHFISAEHAPAGEEVDCSTLGYQNHPNRTCMGLEHHSHMNKKSIGEFNDLYIDVYVYYNELHKEFKEDHPVSQVDKIFSTYLRKARDDARLIYESLAVQFPPGNYPTNIRKYHWNLSLREKEMKFLTAKIDLAVIEKLQNLRLSSSSYEAVFKKMEKQVKPVSKWMHKEKYSTSEGMLERTKHNFQMMMELHKKYSPDLHISVHGLAHIARFEEFPATFASEKYVEEELEKGADQNPYAILAMRPS